MARNGLKNSSDREAYIITCPASGIARATALELAKHGTASLVDRDRAETRELLARIPASSDLNAKTTHQSNIK